MYKESLATFKEEGVLSKFSFPKQELYTYLSNAPKQLEQASKVIEANKDLLEQNEKIKEFMTKYVDSINKINDFVNSMKQNNVEEQTISR